MSILKNGLFLAALIGLAAVIYLPVMVYSGPYGWDDGAITVSFARTVATDGMFALTPESDIVEGTSTIFFMGLMAIFWKIFEPDFYSALFLSKSVSFGFVAASAVLLFFIVRQMCRNSFVALAVSIGYLLLPMNFAEVINGMEMTSFGFLLVVYVLLFQIRSWWALLWVPAILLCRFEGAFYLLSSVALVGIFSSTSLERKFALWNMIAVIGSFLAIAAWRMMIFGTYLPNTIWAKTNPPYSDEGLAGIDQKLEGGLEFLAVYWPLLLAMTLLAISSRRIRPELLRLDFFLIVSFFVFGLIAGRNWGYEGRMFLGVAPVAILFLCRLAKLFLFQESNGTGRRRIWAVLVLPVFLTSVVNFGTVQKILDVVRFGMENNDTQGFSSASHWGDWYGVTPENYRITGEAILKLSEAAGVQRPIVAVPDVGGLGLCCAQLRIIDTALLTNAKLAREGYGGLGDQFKQEQPHVIESHGIWSAVSSLYDLTYFQENFSPIVFRNNLLYARHDVLENALEGGLTLSKISMVKELKSVRYLFAEEKDYLSDKEIFVLSSVK